MDETVQTLESLEIDGRPLAWRHGVLIRTGSLPCEEWTVVLLDVPYSCAHLLREEARLRLQTSDGLRAWGSARLDARDRHLAYMRFVGDGLLRAVTAADALPAQPRRDLLRPLRVAQSGRPATPLAERRPLTSVGGAA